MSLANAGVMTMRWILLVVAILGFALAFSAKSPGLMGIGLLVGFVGLFAALFSFAAARIAATTRPDSTLLTDRDISVLRASLNKRASAPAPASTSTPPEKS
ncbi:MAG: hypothetical protein ABI304_12290 [Rudaea sp.]